MSSFDLYIDNTSTPGSWQPKSGVLSVPLPEPLYFNPMEWKVALMDISFDNTLLNIPETKFIYSNASKVSTHETPASHADDIHVLLSILRSPDPHNLEFYMQNGNIIANFSKQCTLNLPPSLQRITGFPQLVTKGTVSEGYDLYAICSPMVIVARFCEKQILNNAFVKCLRPLPSTFKNALWGQNVGIQFQHPTFVPVSNSEISTVSVGFRTTRDEPVAFSPSGQVSCTLRFWKSYAESL